MISIASRVGNVSGKEPWVEIDSGSLTCCRHGMGRKEGFCSPCINNSHCSNPRKFSAGILSHFSRVRLFETQSTVARQAPLSMGFSRQEHCCHALLWGSFPTQGSNPHLSGHLHWQMDSLPLAPPGKPQRIQTLMGKGTFQPQGLWEHQDSNAALDQEYSMVILQLRHLWDTVPQTWDARVRGIPG